MFAPGDIKDDPRTNNDFFGALRKRKHISLNQSKQSTRPTRRKQISRDTGQAKSAQESEPLVIEDSDSNSGSAGAAVDFDMPDSDPESDPKVKPLWM